MSRRYPDKTVIGLTGNIAVGKSLVRGFLQELGAATIDADRVAHQVMEPGTGAFAAILDGFGAALRKSDGAIDRAALGAIVFADPQALQKLEAIMHPAIREEIDRRIRSAAQRVVVIEAIKLLEGDLKQAVDAVWVVDAPPQTQLQRLMDERGFSQADAEQRIGIQNSQADKVAQADVVIHNAGDIASTRQQVERHWARLQRAG